MDSTSYDAAGNAVRQVPRRGGTLVLSYDAMNRLITRITPAVHYDGAVNEPIDSAGNPWSFPAFPNDGGTGYTIPADTAALTYDRAGRILTANNGDAHITRTYRTDGRLATETEALRTVTGTVFSQHVYVTQYGYDRDGRRSWVRVPTVFEVGVGAGQDSLAYGYDATGQLATVRDPLGHTSRYFYDLEQRVDSVARADGVYEKLFHDEDGRLTRRREGTDTSTWRDDVQRFDAQGRVLLTSGLADSMTYAYAGHGPLAHQLTWSKIAADHRMDEYWSTDALGHRGHLGVGGVLAFDTLRTDLGSRLEPGTGRLTQNTTPRPLGGRIDAGDFTYDAAGNQIRQAVRLQDAAGNYRVLELWSYYDAAQRVRAVDRRSCIERDPALTDPRQAEHCMNQHVDSTLSNESDFYPYDPKYLVRYSAPSEQATAAFEEYRYDALGRRVWRRSRYRDLECMPEGCRPDLVRYVWDGDQLLGEIQVPGDTLHSAVGFEVDVGQVGRDSIGRPTDNNGNWGRVLYVHGRALDQPLGVIRFDYSVAWPQPFLIEFGRDARGTADVGHLDPVIRAACSGGGNCPAASTPTTLAGLAAMARESNFTAPRYWQGSLEFDQQDATGYQYRRNRYLDPANGRFTQEDPLGLAGGLNVYGFAKGDPANYSDPFGLCPPCSDREDGWGNTSPGLLDPVAWFSGSLVGGLFGGAADAALASTLEGTSGTAAIDEIAPSAIRFAQRGSSGVFRHGEFAGQAVKDVAAGLRSGAISPDQLPIKAVVRDGIPYSMNTRSLMALRLADLEPTIIENVTGDEFFESKLTERLAEMGQVPADFVPPMR
ncbi:MAG TPA: RHS repeat-associated core domain-containing protein [Gemmatimonadales bacterium]|nr:RHS repeat-associated core domain-containing protein [Gemmatimonadales bacterium]